MTTDESIAWLRRHGCVVIFHAQRTIVLRPLGRITLDDNNLAGHIAIGLPRGCTFGYTEAPTESLEDVVKAVRATWGQTVGIVDALADAVGSEQPGVELRIGDTLSEKFPGLS